MGDESKRQKQRQGLLQWAWDSKTEFTEKQQSKNLSRLSKLSVVTPRELFIELIFKLVKYMSEEERIYTRFLNWIVDKWYPATAFVYTTICVFDFIIFPMYIGLTREDPSTLIFYLEGKDVQVQRDLIAATIRDYTPLTLRGGGLFHVSFGALLSFGTIFKKENLTSTNSK